MSKARLIGDAALRGLESHQKEIEQDVTIERVDISVPLGRQSGMPVKVGVTIVRRLIDIGLTTRTDPCKR